MHGSARVEGKEVLMSGVICTREEVGYQGEGHQEFLVQGDRIKSVGRKDVMLPQVCEKYI